MKKPARLFQAPLHLRLPFCLLPLVFTSVAEVCGADEHKGGHELGPNWSAFFQWSSNYVDAGAQRANQPAPRTDTNSLTAHRQLLEKAKHGRIDVYFVGDSITRRWGTSDPQYADLLENWKQNFFGWNAANFGWGADKTQNILWRLENSELEGVNPKVIVILAGTNNISETNDTEAAATDIAQGIRAIVDTCQKKAPEATIILTAIFPRNDKDVMPTVDAVNTKIAAFADGKKIRYLNVNDKLVDKGGRLVEGVMNPDQLHPTVKGYQVWADGLKPILTELLGPPARSDLAPPPTGDPSLHRH